MENIITKSIEYGQSTNIFELIERMLICLLGQTEKNCKNCADCNACSFLTQAVFTINTNALSNISSSSRRA